MLKGIQDTGNLLGRREIQFINRSGSALVANRWYAIDLAAAQAESDSLANLLKNGVALDATNTLGICFVAREATADNETGTGWVGGLTDVYVSGTVAKGDILLPTAGQAYAAVAGTPAAVLAGQPYAIAWEANASGTAVVKAVIVNPQLT